MVRGNEKHRDVSPPTVNWVGLPALRCLVIASLMSGLGEPAQALIVGATPNVIPNTATAPADNPGFLNSAKTGTFLNAVYLGDGWMLSAKHTGLSGVQFDHLATQFTPIPNQAYVVPNPQGQGLTDFTDLRLYRVKGDAAHMDPGLPSLTIASQGLPLNAEVVMIGNGVTRAAQESHFSVNNSVNPPLWAEVENRSTYNGYGPSGQGKRWGTNNVADDNAVLNENDPDLTAIVHTNPGDVISYLTVYDENSPNPYEAQAVGGDSGTPVFHKNGSGQWELAGIVNANLIYPGQSTSGFNGSNALAIYGNATAFADLSSYRSQILSIMSSHADYSIKGDVNLDGIVSGNGTGPASSDDITAFVAGWRDDNGTGVGTITSWSKGDLTHDGKTNAADFFKLRQAFGAAGTSTNVFDSIVGGMLGIAVPEPSTAALLLLMAGPLLTSLWRRSA